MSISGPDPRTRARGPGQRVRAADRRRPRGGARRRRTRARSNTASHLRRTRPRRRREPSSRLAPTARTSRTDAPSSVGRDAGRRARATRRRSRRALELLGDLTQRLRLTARRASPPRTAASCSMAMRGLRGERREHLHLRLGEHTFLGRERRPARRSVRRRSATAGRDPIGCRPRVNASLQLAAFVGHAARERRRLARAERACGSTRRRRRAPRRAAAGRADHGRPPASRRVPVSSISSTTEIVDEPKRRPVASAPRPGPGPGGSNAPGAARAPAARSAAAPWR